MAPSSRQKLTDSEIQAALSSKIGWSRVADEITRTFSFDSYKDGLVFAVAVGHLADRLDHHPDLAIGYRKVTVTVSTHSSGGITALDIELAKQIDGLL